MAIFIKKNNPKKTRIKVRIKENKEVFDLTNLCVNITQSKEACSRQFRNSNRKSWCTAEILLDRSNLHHLSETSNTFLLILRYAKDHFCKENELWIS